MPTFEIDVEEIRVEMVTSCYTVTASSRALAEKKAWAGIYDMRQELTATELGIEVQDVLLSDDRDSEELSIGPYCVYVLWGDDDDHPLYVGQSTNLLSRLGQHMNDAEKRTRTKRVEVIHCANRQEMLATERDLIEQSEPHLNTVHNIDALIRRGELDFTPIGGADSVADRGVV